MPELAHIIQFLAFSVGILAIYVALSSGIQKVNKAAKLYTYILIAINLIVFIHVFEAFFKLIIPANVYDKQLRELFLYMIIPAMGIRLVIVNLFIRFYMEIVGRNISKINDYINLFLFILFVSSGIILDNFDLQRPEVVYGSIILSLHIYLATILIAVSILALYKSKRANLTYIKKLMPLFQFLIIYGLVQLFFRIINFPIVRISEHSQMFGIGLLAVCFNLFNVIFFNRIFISQPEKVSLLSIVDFCIKHSITKRESEIIEQICQGKTNKEIADSLFLSPVTVRDHLSSIYKKVHVSSRTQLSLLIK